MLKLSDTLDVRCVKLDLESKRKKDTIKEIVKLLFDAGKIENPEKIEEKLIQREKEGTTGIGGGIAIPHIMAKEVSGTIMAFGRKKEGLKFDAIDKEPVRLIFLLLGPKGEESIHLKLLCRLSRLLHDTQFKEALIRAEREEEIINIFRQKEEE